MGKGSDEVEILSASRNVLEVSRANEQRTYHTMFADSRDEASYYSFKGWTSHFEHMSHSVPFTSMLDDSKNHKEDVFTACLTFLSRNPLPRHQ